MRIRKSFFLGEEKKSTIARFSVQCGEARSKDYLKWRLFANSLTKVDFPWYMNLPPHSIKSWYDLEFHEQVKVAVEMPLLRKILLLG